MDALPAVVMKDNEKYFLTIEKQVRYDDAREYYIFYENNIKDCLCDELSTNLAEALSDMLIRLIENWLYIVNKE